MTAAPEYGDMHRLVDQLSPEQVRALRAVALELVRVHPGDAAGPGPDEQADAVRHLSFAGAGRAAPDLAARSQEILRTELGQPAP
ncbi:MAG TPA: hypothetical protein VMU51_16435 [Mycobacteriales bacterium]|nr:hypothetical protein [Mycobacteriales bacterium]